MKVIYKIKDINKLNNSVVAIGVFDGMHRAHRRILKEAQREARKTGAKSVVLTFWPHPQKQHSIYSLEHRLRLIAELGIDVAIVIKFDRAFSGIRARDFIKDILVDYISAGNIYVGKNFRFGRNAEGDVGMLKDYSGRYNFKLKVFGVIKKDGRKISSTYVRKLITSGNLDKAKSLLLRPVSVFGKVIKGTGIAANLGFATANIDPHHEIMPPSGIYAVKVILDKKILNGACYIGRRPTFKMQGENSIEVHIFDFNKNIYGKYLEIQFIKKIRNDKRFVSPCLLSKQIAKDAAVARSILIR